MVMPESGQRFPFINLEKAIDRAKQVYDGDQRGNEMSVVAAFAVFGYSEKSSGGFQTIAALKAYGLVEDFGASEARKVKLAKAALDFFRDEREGHRAEKLKAFAVTPPLFKALYSHWGVHVPSDAVARSYLKIERGLNEQSARTVLGIYKDNLVYANLKGGDKVADEKAEADAPEDDLVLIKVGDFVQWTSGGVDQFKPPRKVSRIVGRHAFVHGTLTGIDMSELTVVPPPTSMLAAGLKSGGLSVSPPDGDGNEISVLLASNRLQITADVDDKGLEKLELMLAKYKEILKMLQ